MAICSVPECGAPSRSRGMCVRHYKQVLYDRVRIYSRPRGTPEERYWRKVIKRDGGACWGWAGAKNQDGYGQLGGVVDGKRTSLRAHRISYEIHHGPVPEGMIVCHSCDNPECSNPDHLWLGTHQDNSDDKMAKGRSRTRRGDRHGQAKLTANDVRQIRAAEGGYRGIGSRFGVSAATVCLIRTRKTWRHVT